MTHQRLPHVVAVQRHVAGIPVEADVLRIERLHDRQEIEDDAADRRGARRRVVDQLDAMLLVQPDELVEADLDRIDLRRQRLREIVGVAAERVVGDAVLRRRRDDRFGVRLGDVADRRTLDLGDGQAVAAHALHERGQLLRDFRRIDVSRDRPGRSGTRRRTPSRSRLRRPRRRSGASAATASGRRAPACGSPAARRGGTAGAAGCAGGCRRRGGWPAPRSPRSGAISAAPTLRSRNCRLCMT